jgi:epoxyqueuosine reductase
LLNGIVDAYPGCAGRWYVDTGPVLEKAWAEHGGLGWIGKHTNLINRDVGSWIFLGALVLDLELEGGSPHSDYCGTCTACIAACPTDAIIAPYVLDARRCISYLTIENRGPIPTEFREPIGNRIFGCDD